MAHYVGMRGDDVDEIIEAVTSYWNVGVHWLDIGRPDVDCRCAPASSRRRAAHCRAWRRENGP